MASGLLNHKMAVDAQRLGLGKLRGIWIDVSPAGLDATHVGVGKAGDGSLNHLLHLGKGIVEDF